MSEKYTFESVPVLKNAAGHVRQVGFEMEYSGIALHTLSEIITSLFGGEVVYENAFLRSVKDTKIGTFSLELDMPLLKDEVYKTYLEALGIVLDPQQMQSVEQVLDDAVSTVVPYEVVVPPLPLDDLSAIELLREKMYQAGARGTNASFTYAFGLHINPEIPTLEVENILHYLQAFLLLEDWIRMRSEINWTRRITPFINPFPKAYQTLVLRRAYQPDWHIFLTDYLVFNKTRYRSLDLLPAFAWIDRTGLLEVFPQAEKMGARPTFHYRLPNCMIGNKQWRVAQEWYYWALIEKLAHNKEGLHALLKAFETSKNEFEYQRAVFLERSHV